MYISCLSLWDSGITKHAVSCCGSCHDDADEYPDTYGLMEIYEDDLGLPRTSQFGEVVGTICCAVSNFIDGLENRRELLLGILKEDGRC